VTIKSKAVSPYTRWKYFLECDVVRWWGYAFEASSFSVNASSLASLAASRSASRLAKSSGKLTLLLTNFCMALLNASKSPTVCNRLVSLTDNNKDSALSAAARNPTLFALLDLNKGVKAEALNSVSFGKVL
jgi:hypothetical protein